MFRLKCLQDELKQISYTLMKQWKELFQIDSKWMYNNEIKENNLYKRYIMYGKKKKLIKQLYDVELELYNLKELNKILLEANQNKLDKVVAAINQFYIYSLENIKKELNDNLKIWKNEIIKLY